jgi:hypothetical protein
MPQVGRVIGLANSHAEHGAFSLFQGAICGLLALILDVAIGTPHLRAVAAGEMLNPDSYMRLVRLRDILTAHAAIDVVARDNSGAGTVLHWSHLLDSLLLLLALPLTPVVGQAEALRWAGILLGPLAAASLGIAVAWATAPLGQRSPSCHHRLRFADCARSGGGSSTRQPPRC